MKYTEPDIEHIYKETLDCAIAGLSNLPVANGREPSFQGLNGWVYEQTIRFCLENELSILGAVFAVKEQFPLRGRAKADLLVGRVAIEIKAAGFFGDDSEKYKKYRAIASEKNLRYLYITRQESHRPYYLAAQYAFGSGKAFFLTESHAWRNFVEAVLEGNI